MLSRDCNGTAAHGLSKCIKHRNPQSTSRETTTVHDHEWDSTVQRAGKEGRALSLYKKTQIGYTQYVDSDVYVALRRQWMDHTQSAVSRTSLMPACRMLQEPVSSTMLSTECLNAEPFTGSPQSHSCFESSNGLLGEVLTKRSGHP